MKKAIIVGCNGQDGRLLYENLSKRDYRITGIARPSSQIRSDDWRLSLDIADSQAVSDMVRIFLPDEVYYLAAFHHSSENLSLQENDELFKVSFRVHVLSLVNFLEAIRLFAQDTRLFYAASSHVFGNIIAEPQTEQTPFNPTGVYGITKTAGIHTCRFYRNRHRIFASTGILYNHESPYRKPIFVTKKIIDGAINIKKGKQDKLILRNLHAEVDWGYAPDYVEAFRKILGASSPGDFVVATGEKHTVQEFVEITFGYLGLDWTKYVEVEENTISKRDLSLVGDSQKLTAATGWKPSVNLREMIKLLLQSEGVSLHE